jgi:hypothetical protein
MEYEAMDVKADVVVEVRLFWNSDVGDVISHVVFGMRNVFFFIFFYFYFY